MMSTVLVMTTEERDQDPIDPRGYDHAYEVVARRLRRRIERGEFAYHAPLPSEPALSEWYGVSRTTVRSAIRVLSERGMVEVRQGKGTFVTWDASHGASPQGEDLRTFATLKRSKAAYPIDLFAYMRTFAYYVLATLVMRRSSVRFR
jgi:DNA-binding GntR family transcriptional regulator